MINEQLVDFDKEGSYHVCDLQGEYRQSSLGSDASETDIIDARIHETGMVVLTGSLSLLEVKDFTGAKPLDLANAGKLQPIFATGHCLETDLRTQRASLCLDHHSSRLYHLKTHRCPFVALHLFFHTYR